MNRITGNGWINPKWLDIYKNGWINRKRLDMGLNRSKQLDNGWINRKWLDMVLIRSRRLDNLEKWLDKPAMVGYGFESFQMVGYL